MVVGGLASRVRVTDVEIISSDPVNNPVPACLKTGGQFPVRNSAGAGGAVGQGKVERSLALASSPYV